MLCQNIFKLSDTFTFSLQYFPNQPTAVVFFLIFIENSNTIYFLHTIQTKTNILMPYTCTCQENLFRTNNLCCQFCIVFAVKFSCLEFAFQLLSFTSDIIYFQFILLEPTTMQKRFELEHLTSTVNMYSSPVNSQHIDISLFCTQHLIGSI